jgi:general secretion pathway protein B
MSYILQALRKSEQERQRGSIPNLQSAQIITGHSGKKTSIWLPLLVGVLVINAAAMIYWLQPWREKGAVIQTTPTPDPQHAIRGSDSRKPSGNPPSLAPARLQQQASLNRETALNGRSATDQQATRNKKVANQAEAPDAAPIKTSKKIPESSATREQWLKISPSKPRTQNPAPGNQTAVQAALNRESETIPPSHSRKSAAAGGTSASSRPKPVTPAARDVPEPKVPGIHELPVNVQQSLPAIHISAHIYSENPETRMTIINDKTLREGQSVAPGLVLEEITRNGVILRFQGQRFHLGKLQSWRRN